MKYIMGRQIDWRKAKKENGREYIKPTVSDRHRTLLLKRGDQAHMIGIKEKNSEFLMSVLKAKCVDTTHTYQEIASFAEMESATVLRHLNSLVKLKQLLKLSSHNGTKGLSVYILPGKSQEELEVLIAQDKANRKAALDKKNAEAYLEQKTYILSIIQSGDKAISINDILKERKKIPMTVVKKILADLLDTEITSFKIGELDYFQRLEPKVVIELD